MYLLVSVRRVLNVRPGATLVFAQRSLGFARVRRCAQCSATDVLHCTTKYGVVELLKACVKMDFFFPFCIVVGS